MNKQKLSLIHICFAHRYYDAVTVGIDFTARDLQRRFREAGNPWELCKGFDSSAAIGTFVPVAAELSKPLHTSQGLPASRNLQSLGIM